MNRLYTILCMVSMLVFHTSCNDSVMNLESPSVETNTRAADPRIQGLIQQAREGDIEAYNSLASCYRDGDGVEKSWFNMMCMYTTYCQKNGKDFEDMVEQLDEHHPFRLLAEIMDSPSIDEKVIMKLERLKLTAPAEAKAIEAVMKAISNEETDHEVLAIIQEAENEGSELAAIFQALYYASSDEKTGQEEYLVRIAKKFPFLYLLMGDLCIEKYNDTEDFSHVEKALEYYYKADAYGMLIPKYASRLCGMYDYYGQKRLLECENQEIERLERLAKRIY